MPPLEHPVSREPGFNLVELMLEPGANKSVMLFLFEKEESPSVFVDEATEVAFWTHAGEDIWLELPLFPVATTTETFFPTAEFIEEARKSELQ